MKKSDSREMAQLGYRKTFSSSNPVLTTVFQAQVHSSCFAVVWNSSCSQRKLTSSIEVPRSFVPHQGLNLNVLLVLFLQPPFVDLSLARLELLATSPSPSISGIRLKLFYRALGSIVSAVLF
jgi:hypothetical protein